MKSANEKSGMPGMMTDPPEKVGADIVESMRSGVYRADNQGNLSYANQAFAEIFKYDNRDQIVGRNIAADFYKHREDRSAFLTALKEKGYVCNYEIRMVRKDGSVAIVSAQSNFVLDKHGKIVGVEGVLTDVSERKVTTFSVTEPCVNHEVKEEDAFDKHMKFLTEDPLTQLPNYQYFVRSLDYEVKRATQFTRPLCLLMMDVDDFKVFNDEFGRQEADTVLRKIGKITLEQVRQTDILCRHSQDSFVIILPETDKEDAMAIASKIKKAVEVQAFKKKVTVSIGAVRHISGMTWNELFLKANTGLCMAKEIGKNDVCLYG